MTGLFIFFMVLSGAVLLAIAYGGSAGVFQQQAAAARQATLTFRADMLSEKLAQLRGQAESIARIEALQQDLTNLKSGWKTVEKTSGDASKALIDIYITRNPNPADKRERLVKVDGPSGFYFSSHEKTQTDVQTYLANGPFSDLLMADTQGNVIYSYKKTETFARNVATGDLAKSGLGTVYALANKAVSASKDGETADTVFSGLVVSQSTGKTDIYFAVPLLKLGSPRGVVIFKVADHAISDVMSKALPTDGQEQVNIIGDDGRALGVSPQGAIVAVDATPFTFAAQAFAAQAPFQADFHRADGPARAFTKSVTVYGYRYLISESDSIGSLQAGSKHIASLMAGAGVIVILAGLLVSAFFLKRMLSPLGSLAEATQAVAAGDLGATIRYQDRVDEIGVMSRALHSFRQSLQRQKDMEAQTAQMAADAERERDARQTEREAQAAELKDVVAALGSGLGRLAGGDLACRIDRRFPGEFETLRIDFNRSIEQLHDAMLAIGGNSAAVREGSSEMRSSADQLAARTERQSISISQAAAAIDQVTRAVREQLARAEDAAHIAKTARDGADDSAGIMRSMIEAMENIQSSSQKINQIIGVIDEIAFQTNLLALNAGVEAARAGESGKGFAVVAQEVRELAQRSATAAKEITTLLARSTSDVEAGVALVEKAGHAIGAIGGHVADIDGRIRSIMESTREEADSLRAINASVGELETATQQNAAMVEETTAAVHRLAHEAGEMDQRLGQFRLEDDRSGYRMAG
ncbi:methyl-accepting chemotaxis protein [Ensifer adhaerens]|nr:methyl-accepting chemotaxis protein [Ensifer adhaerens]